MPKSSNAQTIVNKKDYAALLEKAREDQKTIGEEMGKYIFGGELEKSVRKEIEKQNAKHNKGDKEDKFSVFKSSEVKSTAANNIISKDSIKNMFRDHISELLQKDAATLYVAFHKFEKDDKNIIGHKKGKGEMGAGRHLAAFPVSIDVSYLENNK